MSFAARLVHDLAIVTPSDAGTTDAYGQPVAGDPVVTVVRGLVQPKRTREIDAESQAGGVVADHVIYLQPQTLSPAAFIRFQPDDGDRYEITGVRSYGFGRTPHLEVDCRRLVADGLAAEGS